MKILGLIGSPRRLGNSELATKIVAKELKGELHLIRLPSLNISQCIGCYRCLFEKPCPLDDDMEMILSILPNYDLYIISSPVYFLGTNVSIKRLLDRGFLFFRILEKMWGKPAINITISGIKEKEGTGDFELRLLSAFMGLNVVSSITLNAALPGDILKEENLKLLKEGAKRAVDEEEKDEEGCPICRNKTLKVLGKGRFLCPFCGSTLEMNGKTLEVLRKGDGFLLSLEGMMEHKRWLMERKLEFEEKKRRIIRAISPYRGGKWLA